MMNIDKRFQTYLNILFKELNQILELNNAKNELKINITENSIILTNYVSSSINEMEEIKYYDQIKQIEKNQH